jgi:hypothetical protein
LCGGAQAISSFTFESIKAFESVESVKGVVSVAGERREYKLFVMNLSVNFDYFSRKDTAFDSDSQIFPKKNAKIGKLFLRLLHWRQLIIKREIRTGR